MKSILTALFVILSLTSVLSSGAIAITNQPVSQDVFLHQTATLSVGVSSAPGEPVLYQWYFNGVAVTNAVNSTLVIENIIGRNLGDYFVRVGNLQGTTQSDTVTLRTLAVTPSEVSVAVELVFHAEDSKVYIIQASTNLTDWATISSPIVGADDRVSRLISTRDGVRTFYRAVERIDTFPKTVNGDLLFFRPAPEPLHLLSPSLATLPAKSARTKPAGVSRTREHIPTI